MYNNRLTTQRRYVKFHGAAPVLTSYNIKPGRHTILNILDIVMKQRKMIVFVILVIFLYNNVVNVQGKMMGT